MSFDIKRRNKDILHFVYRDIEEMSLDFLRFGEYECSKEYVDGMISREDCLRKFNDIGYKCYGFGVRKKTFEDFREFNDLNESEKGILDILKSEDFFYVISTANNSLPTTEFHELAHAFYELDNEYRAGVGDVIARLSSFDTGILFDYLKKRGYGEEVFTDEGQAHLLANFRDLYWKMSENASKENKQLESFFVDCSSRLGLVD
ncbi:MAG: hypothetical protein V1888_04355 [archaeon]